MLPDKTPTMIPSRVMYHRLECEEWQENASDMVVAFLVFDNNSVRYCYIHHTTRCQTIIVAYYGLNGPVHWFEWTKIRLGLAHYRESLKGPLYILLDKTTLIYTFWFTPESSGVAPFLLFHFHFRLSGIRLWILFSVRRATGLPCNYFTTLLSQHDKATGWRFHVFTISGPETLKTSTLTMAKIMHLTNKCRCFRQCLVMYI